MNENTPVEVDEFDDIDYSDIVDETTEVTENEGEADDISTSEDTEKEVAQEVDFNTVLKEIGKKIKYNHQEGYEFKDEADLISAIQKGLNYDKVKESKVMQYAEKKAKELGMTPDEYIAEVEKYEMQQQEEVYAEKKQSLLDRGVEEAEANEIIEALKLKSQPRAEKVENKEMAEFVAAFPDVDYSTIPEEVLNSKEPIKEAYLKYENKKLKQELEKANQVKTNIKTSPVKQITSTGAVEDEGVDIYTAGFDD